MSTILDSYRRSKRIESFDEQRLTVVIVPWVFRVEINGTLTVATAVLTDLWPIMRTKLVVIVVRENYFCASSSVDDLIFSWVIWLCRSFSWFPLIRENFICSIFWRRWIFFWWTFAAIAIFGWPVFHWFRDFIARWSFVGINFIWRCIFRIGKPRALRSSIVIRFSREVAVEPASSSTSNA